MKNVSLIFAVFALMMVMGSPAFAGVNEFTTNGPYSESGLINIVVVSPVDDQTVFAGTSEGIFKSTDGGATWNRATVHPGLLGGNILSLVITQDGKTIFAGTWSGESPYSMFKSTDGGATWIPLGLGGMSIYAIDTANDGTVFALAMLYNSSGASGMDILKSTDGGATWNAVQITNAGLDISTTYTYLMALSPNFTNDKTIFVGIGSRAYKSTDGGATWTSLSIVVPADAFISSLAISPNYAKDGTVFFGAYGYWWYEYGGLYKSTDGGTSWALNASLPAAIDIPSIAMSPNFTNDKTIFVGSGINDMFKSTDGGTSWISVNAGLANPTEILWSFAVSPNYPVDPTLYAGTYEGDVVSISFTPPTSIITGPEESASLNGASCIVTGTATPAGNVTVQAVEVGITPSGSSATKWYSASGTTSWSCSLALPANGSYIIQSRATDTMENVETPSVGVTVTVDNIPPTIVIKAPKDNTTVKGKVVTISGKASDAVGLGVATVQVGIAPSGGTTTWYPATGTISWRYKWNLPVNGSYVVQVAATDKIGNTGVTAESVSVENPLPHVVVTAPIAGKWISSAGKVVKGTASDAVSGIANVEVVIASATTFTQYPVTGTASWKYTWQPIVGHDGPYTITATATDKAGNQKTSPAVSVMVDTAPPTSSITAPSNGATVSGRTYAITGTASDVGSGVKKVQVGITPSGSTKTAWHTATGTAFWSFNWHLPKNGSYTVQSKAMDKAGNTAASAAVDVTVSR